MADLFDYDVFLSHNRADKDWTRILAARIEREKWNGRALKVFFDEWDIQPGDNIPIALEQALPKSRKIALVMSPDFFKSEWTESERAAATIFSPANRGKRMIPLLLRDCEIPSMLAPLKYIDFRDVAKFETGFKQLLAFLREEPLPRNAGNLYATNIPVPRSPAIGFVARRDKEGHDLTKYVGGLLANDNAFVVLWGEGGVGKTALAAEIARKYERVVWTSADGRADYSLGTLLDDTVVQMEHTELRPLEVEKKIQHMHALLARSGSLLVLDNFETIGTSEQARLNDFLVNLPCAVLVTSRKTIPKARNILIDAMAPSEAHEFVNKLIELSPRRDVFAGIDISQIISTAAANPKVMEWIVVQIDDAREPRRVFEELSHGEGDAAQRVFDRSFNLLSADARAALLALTLFVPNASRDALTYILSEEDSYSGLSSGLLMEQIDGLITRLVSLRLAETSALNKRIGVIGLTRELAKVKRESDTRKSNWEARFSEYFTYILDQYGDRPYTFEEVELDRENFITALDVAFARNDWLNARLIAKSIVDSAHLAEADSHWGPAIAHAKRVIRKVEQIRKLTPSRHIRIFLTRTNDHDEDIMRMRELFRLLTSAQGFDRFTFFVPNPNGIVQLDFPRYTTNYRIIEDHLAKLMSEWGTHEVQ